MKDDIIKWDIEKTIKNPITMPMLLRECVGDNDYDDDEASNVK